MYLAPKRAKTLENFYLTGKYTSTVVKENLSVKLEHQRLRIQSRLLPLNKFIVTLLNARSLKSHKKWKRPTDSRSVIFDRNSTECTWRTLYNPHLMVYLTLRLILVLANTVVFQFAIKKGLSFSIIIDLMIHYSNFKAKTLYKFNIDYDLLFIRHYKASFFECLRCLLRDYDIDIMLMDFNFNTLTELTLIDYKVLCKTMIRFWKSQLI